MKLIKTLTMAGLASTLSMSAAQAALITGGFTGSWFNPDTGGQGFQLQVLPDGRAVAFWFTYDASGNQIWLIGNNTIKGNRLELKMSMPTGPLFSADFDSEDVQLQSFGDLTLTFENCNQGTMSWQSDDPQFGSGSMPIKRLTKSAGVSCSASLVDNRSGSDPVLDFRIPLVNEGAGAGAKGRADYESRPGRVEFEVEVEDIPVGDYPLLVDGIERGIIKVRDTDDGPEGEIEFSSPRDDDDLLLDFEPLGALIEVTNGSSVLFSGILDPEFAPPGDDDDDDDDDGSPGFGSSEIEVDFINTGLDGDASGDAELEQQANRVEFDVEIEDLDIGTYELWVAGVMRAEIEVVQFDDDDTEGEVEFRNPVEPGKLLLDFDPRGQLISIEQAGAVFLTVDFPSEPGVNDDDDDDDDDSGSDDGSNDDDDDDDEAQDDGSNDDDDDDDDSGSDDGSNDDDDDDSGSDDGSNDDDDDSDDDDDGDDEEDEDDEEDDEEEDDDDDDDDGGDRS